MKVAIIGAGAAGLFAGWELKHRAISADIFEAHGKPGGCASFFRRGIEGQKVCFDAGATVLWALGPGEYLDEKLRGWNLSLPAFERARFHGFTLGRRRFELDATSPAAWTNSLGDVFPADAQFIQHWFPIFFAIAQRINRFLYSVPAEPLVSLAALRKLPTLRDSCAWLRDFALMPRRFAELLDNKISADFRAWIDQMLLISLQARANAVDTFYGAAALCFFPLGSGSLRGGMASLFEPLAKNFAWSKGELRMRTKISRITRDRGFVLWSSDQSFGPYTHVLLSSPRWNSTRLFDEKLFDDDATWPEVRGELWSAVIGYIALLDTPALPADAFNHQVIDKSGDFYFSVSRRADELRAPDRYRVCTVSTHTRLSEWSAFADYRKKASFGSQAQYLALKNEWGQKIRTAGLQVFGASELVHLEMGTPKTIEHYTQRIEGTVGGIPLTQAHSLFRSPSQFTRLPGVLQIGDTSFPGQSVVNCAIGAAEAVRKLMAMRNS